MSNPLSFRHPQLPLFTSASWRLPLFSWLCSLPLPPCRTASSGLEVLVREAPRPEAPQAMSWPATAEDLTRTHRSPKSAQLPRRVCLVCLVWVWRDIKSLVVGFVCVMSFRHRSSDYVVLYRYSCTACSKSNGNILSYKTVCAYFLSNFCLKYASASALCTYIVV